MTEKYFPWQSWSPAKPNLFRLPTRDYCTLKQIHPPNPRPKNFKLKSKISGWCSWYAFGPSISHKLILRQAKIAKKLRLKLNYILIDDGWCLSGDWLNPYKQLFPQGIDKISQKNHTKIVLNPGRKELDTREYLLKQAERVDYLVLNREEAARLVDCTIVDETLFKKIDTLFEKTIVLVTEAEKGVNVIIPQKGHFFSESFKVEMIDATGAGDAFSAGFVGGLALNFDLQKAVKLGCANGFYVEL